MTLPGWTPRELLRRGWNGRVRFERLGDGFLTHDDPRNEDSYRYHSTIDDAMTVFGLGARIPREVA